MDLEEDADWTVEPRTQTEYDVDDDDLDEE
jgi:hypothetical protein